MLGEPAFTIGCREYLWLDVVLSAMWRGDWAPFEAALREGLACSARAEASGEEAGQAADDLLAEFRYGRNLITAVEAEAWLERVGLTEEDLGAWCQRRVLRERWAGDLPGIVDAHPLSGEELAGALPAEGMCSGAFERFAHVLAGRAAVYESESAQHAGQGLSPDDVIHLQHVRQGFSPAEIISKHAWALEKHAPSDCLSRLVHLAAVDRAFEAAAAREVTRPALQARVAANRLDWMRVVVERLVFPQESMAREAVLCCRDDHLTLGELSAEIHRGLEREESLLAACDPDLQAAVLSAPAGQVVGPLRVGDTYHVLVVRQKQVPSLDDPRIRALAQQATVDALADRERKARVRWGTRF